MARELAPSKTESGTEARLRPLTISDVDDVLGAFRSSEDMARQGNVTSLQEAHEYVEALIDLTGSHQPWGITLEGQVIGLVCVTVDEENLNGWFFYWMALEGRGRGWVKRAAATVADWALSQGGLFRLELGHRVNNPGSGAVARAAGFVKEGTERAKFLVNGERIDVDIYSRLRTDPWPHYCPLVMQQTSAENN